MSTVWKLTEQQTFSAPGAELLLFHDFYPEGHQGGIELVLHGERLLTNGDLRLFPTPGQWDALPKAGQRAVAGDEVHIPLSFSHPALAYQITVRGEGQALAITVDLEQPLPGELTGCLGFVFELYPAAFFSHSYHLDEQFGVFPRQANGPVACNAQGHPQPIPLARGAHLAVAPETPLSYIELERLDGELALYDGRDYAPNGWFVVHAPVNAGVTHAAVQLRLTPHRQPGWTRPPVLLFSQIGYHTQAEKRLLVEIDPQSAWPDLPVLERLQPNGQPETVLSAPLIRLPRFLRYDYGMFDFSQQRQPGLYRLRLGETVTPPFPIAPDVLQRATWQPTLETHLPVQMCHVRVMDGSRIWHAACHLDDALQAPLNTSHFDSYHQYEQTDTPYAPLEHIPHLDRGGWHDAGDYDLAAGSQAMTTWTLALIRESLGLDSDQTTVLPEQRLVILHRPDGIPDVVQQVAHGVENLLGGYRATRAADSPGHSFIGIIEDTIEHYVLLGDTASQTDQRIYDSALAPNEVQGNRSGAPDDRWAFTQRNTALEYRVAGVLAAASRVLRGWFDDLAGEALHTAQAIWESEHRLPPADRPNCYLPRRPEVQEVIAAVELLLTTHAEAYTTRLKECLPVITAHPAELGWVVARALPVINDAPFTAGLRQALSTWQPILAADLASNPFGVPFHPHVWGVGWNVQAHGMQAYYLHKAFPDLFGHELVTRALDYVLGLHPASSTSLVSGVGAQSLTVAYGTNRAEWSYIPGGVASGPNLVRPDLPELKEPWPWLWQQAEYVIGGAASYIFLVLAVDELLS